MSVFGRSKKMKRDGEWWQNLLSRITTSGITVTADTALNYSPVFACVSLASETLSTLPLGIYQKTETGRISRTDHPVYNILHNKANSAMTAQVFREIMQWNSELRGVALAKKVRNGFGKLVELWPISPDAIAEYRLTKSGKLEFVKADGNVLRQEDVFFFYGPGSNGVVPKSRITLAAESLSVGMAAEQYGRRFFGEGTNIGGFLKHDKRLSPEAYERLKMDMNEKYKGLQKSHGVIILEEGMEFQKIGLTNNDSQFLETRRFEVEEVVRWFGMKPHMIGDLSHATFSNIEQQGIEAVTYSWRPRCVRWEQAINSQLLDEEGLYAEHNLDGLMRGDLPSQAAAWHILLQDGVLNANEVRQLLNMNPQDGKQGTIYFMPLNMSDKSQPAVSASPTTASSRSVGGSVERRRAVSAKIRDRFVSAVEAIVSDDIKLLRTKLDELGEAEFREYLNKAYSAEFAPEVKAQSSSVITTYALLLFDVLADEVKNTRAAQYDDFVTGYIDKFSTRYTATTARRLKPCASKAAMELQLDAWARTRAAQISEEELTRERSAFSKAAYAAAGVEAVRWVTANNECKLCRDLDGVVIGINEKFGDVGHAPAVPGCDCDIIAEV